MRIDDLDTYRCRAEHEQAICAALTAFGLESSREPWRQSVRAPRYAEAEHKLARALPLFHCDCTRRHHAAEAEPGCARDCRVRDCNPAESALRADLRGLPALRVEDRSLGEIRFDPQVHRDVIIRRRDGLHSYHLATVVDDAEQGVTDVVRGADLLPSTGWQLALQAALDLPTPSYLHLPLVVEGDGRKLAKSRHAAPLDPGDAARQLRRVIGWLRQPSPPLTLKAPRPMLEWLQPRWDPATLQGVREVRLQD